MKADEGASEEERRAAEEDVARKTVDVDYAQYYPLDVPYSSLWPSGGKKGKTDDGKDGQKDGDEARGDREMWELVRKCGEEGKLDALRNGKIYKIKNDGPVNESAERSAHGLKKARADKKQKAKETVVANEDEDSDGGFFE